MYSTDVKGSGPFVLYWESDGAIHRWHYASKRAAFAALNNARCAGAAFFVTIMRHGIEVAECAPQL